MQDLALDLKGFDIVQYFKASPIQLSPEHDMELSNLGRAARLSYAPRCGALSTFTPEFICQIMALACQDPETLDVPISHWSQSELARQSVARGIVKSISHGSVGRFLKKRPISSRISTVTG